MHRIFAAALALPLLLGAGAAMAEQATGTVDSVDPTTKTVVVNGQPYMLESQAAGLKIDQIKVGDKVTVQFDVNTNNVSQIDHAK
jgi:Cu/Ag efflux protein CusF